MTSYEERYYEGKRDPATSEIGFWLLAFVFLALIIWAVLAVGQPTWCLRPNTDLDNGKTFGAALLISVIVVLFIAFVFYVATTWESGAYIASVFVITITIIVLVGAVIWYFVQ